MHISSIYGKILGEISRSKAKDIEKKKRERLNDGNNNGQARHGARIAHASRLGQKVGENNGQLRFRPPPRVVQASCLDQLQFE